MSLGNDPGRVRGRSEEDLEASEAVAGARQARAYLAQDGAAPSVEAILEEMGRDPEGYPLEDGPTEIAASRAARRALGLEDDRQIRTDGGSISTHWINESETWCPQCQRYRLSCSHLERGQR